MRTINADDLMERLRITDNCETCPRGTDGYCKGHLQWLCKAIIDVVEGEVYEQKD